MSTLDPAMCQNKLFRQLNEHCHHALRKNRPDRRRQSHFTHEDSAVAAYVTVSIGPAIYLPDDALDVRQLIELADVGLYEVKTAGRIRTATARLLPEMSS